MSKIPSVLVRWLARVISKSQAEAIWDWLQSNSNTVIVDELEIAIRERRDWHDEDER